MLNITSVVKTILTHNDCVAFPGIGGFSASYQPASVSGSEFAPPRKGIVFKENLVYDNDALLNHCIHETHGDVGKAQEMLKQATDTLKQELEAGKSIYFESIGTISYDAEKKIRFVPSDDNLLKDSFGLQNFTLEPLQQEPKQEKQPIKAPEFKPIEHTEKKEETVQVEAKTERTVHVEAKKEQAPKIETNQTIINKIHMTTPEPKKTTTPVMPEGHKSSALKWVVISLVCILIAGTAILFFNDEYAKKLHVAGIIDKIKSVFVSEPEPVVVEAPPAQEQPKDTTAAYYAQFNSFSIIAGSYYTRRPAAKYQKALKKKGYKAEILKSGEALYRISIETFGDRNEALKVLDQYRAELGGDVWILSYNR